MECPQEILKFSPLRLNFVTIAIEFCDKFDHVSLLADRLSKTS